MAFSTTTSACTDLREINDAKVNNIMCYLDGVNHDITSDIIDDRGSSHQPLTFQDPLINRNCGPLQVGGTSSTHHQQLSHGMPLRNISANSCSSFSSSVFQMQAFRDSENAHVYGDIKRKIDELKRKNTDLEIKNDEMTKRLDEAKAKENARVENIQGIAKGEIEALREELRKNHKTHVEQMTRVVSDKETLLRRCEELSKEVVQLKDNFARERRKLEDAHVKALNDTKGKWLVSEKQKREEWMQKEAKRIKTTTLKAMEPDIALLMSRHKAEKGRLEEEFGVALKRKDEMLAAKDVEINELKEKMNDELESFLAKERDTYRSRVLEENQRCEAFLVQQRKEFADKTENMEALFTSQKNVLMATIKTLEQQILDFRANDAIRDGRFEAEVTNEVERQMLIRNQIMNEKEKKHEEERAARLCLLEAENKASLARKEEEVRLEMRRERDEAISKIMRKLESEHLSHLNASKEISSLEREKYSKQDRELQRLTLEHRLTSQNLDAATQRLDEQIKLVDTLSAEIQDLKERNKQYASVAEKDFESRLHALDSVWQNKLHRSEANHVEEIESIIHKHSLTEKVTSRKLEELEVEMRNSEQRHNTELSTINDRIVAAVAKRDANIQMLQEQLRIAHQCVHEREAELERHRMLLT